VIVCAAGLAGCASEPEDPGSVTPPAEAPLACTEIGCDSGLFADLSGLRDSVPEAARVKLCLDSVCETLGRARFSYAAVVDRGLASEGDRSVSMVVFGDSGNVLYRSSVRAPAVRSRPNGKGCPPVCFQISVGLDSDGRLVR
jgi:hypothetical protein